jgi:ABC-type molybdenum transport system ATPase subunit/photorepair protein PhrA
MSTSKDIISIQNLHVAYKNDVVLRDFSLFIGKNERWAVMGKNGTGNQHL